MQLQNFYAQDVNGNIVPGAICSLFLPGTTTLATGLQDVNGLPLTNPFAANSDGLVQFAAPNGKYDLKIEAGLIVSTLPITFADTYQALIQLGGFLPPSATPPIVRADGTPLQLGDRYMKTPEDIEYIYKTSGWEANNLDGQLLAAPGGADLVGFGDRTVADRFRDLPSLMDYMVSGPVDGISSNQADIVTAVTANQGKPLLIPDEGVQFVSDANIPGFHNVIWVGTGAIRRGANIYRPKNFGSNRNILYVSAAGTGDGLSDAQPASLEIVATAFEFMGPVLGGLWRVIGTAETHPAPATWFSGLVTSDYIEFFGPPMSGGVPTFIIDAGGASGREQCLRFVDGTKALLRDVKLINATATSVASGAIFDRQAQGRLENVHTYNTQWAGVNFNEAADAVVLGGRFESSATYGIRSYGSCIHSVGSSTGPRPQFVDCVGAGFVGQGGGSYGHVDFADFINCGIGVNSVFHSHSAVNDCTFTNCATAWQCDGLGTLTPKNYTITGGTRRERSRWSPNMADDQPYRFENQYYPASGATGRSSFGYTDWLVPTVKYQYSNNGTAAGFNLSAGAAATALWESNSNTILMLAAPDAAYSGYAALNSTGVHTELRAQSASWTMRFTGANAYSFSAVRMAPSTDNDKALGNVSARFSDGYIARVRLGAGTTILTSGAGTPEGSLTAPVGSQYTRTDGAANTTLYIKESGTGNTGWVAK